jgi:hypothetical protein
MHTSGTIYPDGRVQYHGYERMDSRVLFIDDESIVIHHPGGRYWDNGGGHYVSARIEVWPLAELRPANEEGHWLFQLDRGRGATFHPVPKQATANAMWTLRERGDEIMKRMKAQKEES